MPDVLVFHTPEGHEVHIPRASVVEWYRAGTDTMAGTHITLTNGFHVVQETVAEVQRAYDTP